MHFLAILVNSCKNGIYCISSSHFVPEIQESGPKPTFKGIDRSQRRNGTFTR